MEKRVCILDYGSGNVKSVYNIFLSIDTNVCISNAVCDIEKATHLILPGVGAFGSSMEKIKKLLPLDELKRIVLDLKKPFLGICVGMQVLADIGHEFGSHDGLGWIHGSVKKLESGVLPLPHVGWNEVEKKKESILLDRFLEKPDFYFVHSFVFCPEDKHYIVAETCYGMNFCSMIQKENIFGVQFHPEKSQNAGKLLLKNFLTTK